jgi:hypothetical protein
MQPLRQVEPVLKILLPQSFPQHPRVIFEQGLLLAAQPADIYPQGLSLRRRPVCNSLE